MRRISVLLFGLMSVTPLLAHNNYFLPGDSFFSVAVPQTMIIDWQSSKSDSIELSYSRFDGDFYACGNIGYSSLNLTGVTPEFRRALAEAYWRFVNGNSPLYREEEYDGKKVLEQTNSVVALVYGKDFDLKFPLGLKFNEDWQEQGGGRYAGLYSTARPVVLDWSAAKDVAPLPLDEVLDPAAHLSTGYEVARTIDKPLSIHADKVMIVLVGFTKRDRYEIMQTCPGLQEIMDSEDDARYMVVTSTKIRDFTCGKNGLWNETVIDLPVTSDHSYVPEKFEVPEIK